MSFTFALGNALLRRMIRPLVALTAQEQEWEREDARQLPSREKRAEAARQRVDAHLAERDARRAHATPPLR